MTHLLFIWNLVFGHPGSERLLFCLLFSHLYWFLGAFSGASAAKHFILSIRLSLTLCTWCTLGQLNCLCLPLLLRAAGNVELNKYYMVRKVKATHWIRWSTRSDSRVVQVSMCIIYSNLIPRAQWLHIIHLFPRWSSVVHSACSVYHCPEINKWRLCHNCLFTIK